MNRYAPLLFVPQVVHDEAAQRAVRCALADMEREPGFGRGKPARLDHLGEKIRAHLDHDVPQQPEAPRHRVMVHERNEAHDDQTERHQWLGDRPRRRPGRREHDDFAVAVEAVEGVDGRDQQREGSDDGDETRQAERRHLDQGQRALALTSHNVEFA
jgi:hypothetical protein